jgi:glycosyltransferase involved in cell wall biosynthesis
MRRLLLVTYFFPPLGGPGVFRPLRLAKYLPREGWQVTVLTVDARVRVLKDPDLLRDVPPEVRVERSATLEPRSALIALNKLGLSGLTKRIAPWLMLPDDQRGWVFFARRRGLKVLLAERHDAIVSTAGPYSAHLVGLALARRSHLPWIADFRDEWTGNPYLAGAYPTRHHLEASRRWERRVLEEATRVTCVSAPWLDGLRAVVPQLDREKFWVLPNGYDGEHFPSPLPAVPERFRIVYTGMFYGHRSATPFLDGLQRALAGGGIDRDDVEVLFVGHTGFGELLPAAVRSVVKIVEHRPHFEAIETMRSAAVLLLVVPRAGGPGNHTGKLFPYLAAGRPILALAPEPNVAADLIRKSRSGIVVAPDDPAAIAAGIERLYREWKSGRGLPDQDRSLIATFDAEHQSRDWVRLLEELTSRV